LIAVCGSTGTGKSQLAVELAKHIGQSEIISADSMQLYQGLDTITNKVTNEEMQGVPHHLMSFLEPRSDDEYDVGSFVRNANKVIKGMLERDMLPIIVGGTTYYLQHLILPGRLVSVRSEDDEKDEDNIRPTSVQQFSLIDVEKIAQEKSRIPLMAEQVDLLYRIVNLSHSSTIEKMDQIEIWKLLNCLDEEMAKRWHFRDFRKITRSIKVLFETGRRHSELIVEQKMEQNQQNEEAEDPKGGDQTRIIIFNLACDRQVLNQRLDSRVEKMIEVGYNKGESGWSMTVL